MSQSALAALEWMIESGIDECLMASAQPKWKQAAVTPVAIATTTAPKIIPAATVIDGKLTASPAAAVEKARALADQVTSLEELREAVASFDGCALKKTARNTVFADGNPVSGLMLIGEAPGADEDRQGIPFCGASGQLLDKMLGCIGRTRSDGFYICNTIFWRPPGNRNPTPEELAICEPFVEKHIALVAPKALLLIGGIAAKHIMKKDEGITRLRGKIYEYTNSYMNDAVQVHITFHPSYLLRQPSHKKFAWQDLLQLQSAL